VSDKTRSVGAPSPESGPISRFYISQHLRLHYADWGNHGAPPLLLIHGGRDHARSWDWVARALRGDYHVLAVDLRGHGDSEWAKGSSYPIPDAVYDIVQLVDQLALSPVTIVGHSLGGAIGMLYAGTYPEKLKRLIVIEGWIWPPQQQAKDLAVPADERIRKWVDQLTAVAARAPRKYSSLDAAIERMMAENTRLSLEQAAHLTRHGMTQNEDGTYSWKYDNYNRATVPYKFTDQDVTRLWSRIACPTLLMRGAEGPLPDPAAAGLVGLLPDATAVNVSGAGHWVHHDRLDDVVALVRSFAKG